MIPYAPCRQEVGGGGAGAGGDPRASGPGGGAGRWVRREELRLRRRQCETGVRGMSAHHVVAVDAVRGVLHAVVDFSSEHREVLGEPSEVRGGRERGWLETDSLIH